MPRPERQRSAPVFVSLIAIVLVLASCLSTNLQPIGSGPGSFTAESDEVRLWSYLRDVEGKVAPQTALYQDERLSAYLTGLVERLTPADYARAGGSPIRVVVRKDPRLNASAMAHGLIVVNSGILARADNEAQLAAVLGHEVTHITHRHTIRHFRAAQNRQTAINVAAFVASLALAAAAVDQANRGNPAAAQALINVGAPALQIGLQLTFTAMVSGYSRDLETEADQQGIRLMAQQGYEPKEMAQFFRKLLVDSPDGGSIETFFWGNHPKTSERVQAAEAFARTYPGAGTPASSQEFESRTAAVRLANAQLDAYLGRAALARSQVDRTVRAIPERPEKGVVTRLFYAHLMAANSNGLTSRGQTDAAMDASNKAVSMYESVILDSARIPAASKWLPVAYKSLGLFYHAQRDTRGRHCEAKAALEKYLELAPSAADRTMTTERLRELSCASQPSPTAQVEPTPPAKSPPACSSGESWDRLSGRCVRSGDACASGEYWSSLRQSCKKLGE